MFKINGMREFEEMDWCGYADAEEFEDGTKPLIYEYGSLTLIASKGVITAIVSQSDDDFTGYTEISNSQELTKDLCERIIRDTKAKTRAELERYFTETLGM